MNFAIRLAAVSLASFTLLGEVNRSMALDDWGEAVDVAVCFRGNGYKKAVARIETLARANRLNGFAMEFHHDKDGKIHQVSFQDKPEGFVVLVQDDTVRAARKLLRAEIAAGLQVTLLHRSLFFPERNAKEFIRKNGSWDSPDLEWRQKRDASFRKASEEAYEAR